MTTTLTQRPMNAVDERYFCWNHVSGKDYDYAMDGGVLVVGCMREHLGDWELPTMVGNVRDILYYAQDVRGRSLASYRCSQCGDTVCHGYVDTWESFMTELSQYDVDELRQFVIC